jgi:rhodanese-related sulfurtransferase
MSDASATATVEPANAGYPQAVPPAAVAELLRAGKPCDLIDVRTPAEYAGLHAQAARLVPLDQLDPAAVMAARAAPASEPLYLLCKSGQRAAKAREKFLAAGFTAVCCVEGGTENWERQGLPVVRGSSKVISLERQVRIVAGAIVFIGTLLGLFVHRGFLIIPAFIGAGLVFAGITDFCGMGMLLARMPWNQRGAGGCSK